MADIIESLIEAHHDQLVALERQLGYNFQDWRHLQEALIHSSFAFEQTQTCKDNETLEFLGDAVLDLTVGYTLFKKFPAKKEGELTKLRAALVNEHNLAMMARAIGLGDFLYLGRGEIASQGREKPSILAGAYEAVLGAIFLDGAFAAALAFVEKHFLPHIIHWTKDKQTTAQLVTDPKSLLQEKIQEKFNEAPIYVIEKEEGPDHNKIFTASVRFRGEALGTGMARSKKEAEQQAATAAINDFADRFGLAAPADDKPVKNRPPAA